jgi:serine/threonine protein kinase/formylglycine-generating enzyme required for sulfatase activity
MNEPGSNHPNDQALRDYSVGKLCGVLAESVQAHLVACIECRNRVAETSPDTFLSRMRNAVARPETSDPAVSSFADLSGTAAGPGAESQFVTRSGPSLLGDLADFEILRELGRGGMGVVYLARNKLLGRKEVLKVVNHDLVNRRGVHDRFLREMQHAAGLHHANIVTAYSAIRHGESIVFAMEYVEGYDLGQLVRSQGPLTVAQACNFIHQAAVGLQYAHEQGMVHRDIKPSNLILTRVSNKPVVKLLDFGLAKATREGSPDAGLTCEGQILGTPDYIAPEQAADAQRADIRADIYSLGCTLYYVLSGRPPFPASSLYEVLQAHQSMDARPLNLVRPEVPWELAAIAGRMMAKDPVRRFQTPREVAQALKPFFAPSSQAERRPAYDVSYAADSEMTPRESRAASASHTRRQVPKRPTAQPGPASGSHRGRSATEPEPQPEVIEIRPAGSLRVWAIAVASIIFVGLACASGAWVYFKAKGRFNDNGGLARQGMTTKPGKVASNAAVGVRAPDATIVLQNLPPGGVVEIDGEEVSIAATLTGMPLTLKSKPGKHVVIVRRGTEVLLAKSVALLADNRVVLSIPLPNRSQPPAPSLASGSLLPAAQPPTLAAVQPQAAAAQSSSRGAEHPSTAGTEQPPSRPARLLKKIELVRIEGGEFTMGSPEEDFETPDDEKPQRRVQIRSFYLGATEVTQEQYEGIMGGNPSDFSPKGAGRRQVDEPTQRYPVETVSWYDAVAFCNGLSKVEGFDPYYRIEARGADGGEQSLRVRIADPTGPGYRLPTEAEWEYACRAGSTTQYPFAEDPSKLPQSAWFDDNSANMAHPVGEKRSNAWGLFDMYGNVAEWCWDVYAAYDPDFVANPRGPDEGPSRVIRGGSWRAQFAGCRPAARGGSRPTVRDRRLGFRVAKYGTTR